MIEMIEDVLQPFASMSSCGGCTVLEQAVLVLLSATLWTSLSYASGIFLGIPLGVLAGCFIAFWPLGHFSSRTLITVIRGSPLLALTPLFIYLTPSPYWAQLAFIVFAVSSIVAINMYDVIHVVPTRIEDAAHLARAHLHTYLRRIVTPFAFEKMVASLQTVSGYCWAFTLGAQYISSARGLGHLFHRLAERGKLPSLVLLLAVFLGLAIITRFAVAALERRARTLTPHLRIREATAP